MSLRACLAGVALVLALAGCGESITSPPGDLFRATTLSAGPGHVCATSPDGSVYCWGDNALGAFGQPAPASSFTPIKVPGVSGLAFVQVSTGFAHACALTESRDAYCWGWGVLGQTGAGGVNAGPPTLVVGGHAFSALSAGWYHTCGLDSSGAAWCWGHNSQGQLGDSTTADRYAPVAVAGGLRFGAISAGGAHTCAITLAGAAYCWGANENGQLGNGSSVDAAVPVPVAGGLLFTRISAGYSHSCGSAGGRGYCWGSSDFGELGNNAVGPLGLPASATPSATVGGLAFQEVDAGYHHSCGLVGGQAYCWGAGIWGQLGTGLMQDQANPGSVAGPAGFAGPDALDFVSISPGGFTFSCGLTAGGGVFCWGRGEHGELGRPQVTVSALPARVVAGD